MSNKKPLLLPICLAAVLFPSVGLAAWQVIVHDAVNAGTQTRSAAISNPDGYSLEVYRDGVGAVRMRFTLREGLLAFAERSCPSYQIDRSPPQNRSLNQAPCLSGLRWAEFILGYIKDNSISSSTTLALMNGIAISYRFKLKNGDYRETRFSLYGSRAAMLGAFGGNIQVGAAHRPARGAGGWGALGGNIQVTAAS